MHITALKSPDSRDHRSVIHPDTVKKILKNAAGCKVVDEERDGGYTTPLDAEGEYQTFISRIRKDHSNKKAINIFYLVLLIEIVLIFLNTEVFLNYYNNYQK